METRQHRRSLLTSQMASPRRGRFLISAIVCSALLATAALAQQVNTSDGATRTTTDSAFQLYWDNTADVWKFRCAPSDTAGSTITWTDGPTLNTSCTMSGAGGSASAATPDRGIQFNSGGAFAADSTFVYTSAGNVGIGTTSPGATTKLAVNGGTIANPINVYSDYISGAPDVLLSTAYTGNIATVAIGNAGNGHSGLLSFAPGSGNTSIFGDDTNLILTAKSTGYIDLRLSSWDGTGVPVLRINSGGNVGIGTSSPQSSLHVPDGKYLQAEDNNAGAPPSGDCDADSERGRISLDTSNNRIYFCMGATRGWDYAALTD